MKTIMKIPAAVILPLVAASLESCSTADAAEEFHPAEYVNTFIGASTNIEDAGAYHGLGKTFPGATVPYGMVQVSPNTITGGDNSPGYSNEHKTIEGFALTQMSGVGWFGEMGNFLVMPTTGPFCPIAGKEDGRISGYRSPYDKASEESRPGYYSVDLTRYGIKAETTATQRCGLLRFTFPESDCSRIQVDLARRVGGTSTEQMVRMVGDRAFEGWMYCCPDGGGWGDGEGNVEYTLYFHGTIDRVVRKKAFWEARIADGTSRHKDDVDSLPYLENIAQADIIEGRDSIRGKHTGFFFEFPTSEGEEVVMKVGISYVDIAGARNNYVKEAGPLDFDAAASAAYRKWDDELGRIKVAGGTDDEKTVFYTALYHTMIDPRICSDCDGRFMGGDGKVHESDGRYERRTVFSGWDVYRSQFPLQAIINPRLVSDQINSLVELATETGRGYFERWELLNAYSGCMIGNPALPVIADAYVKGIRTFDAPKALEYAKNTSDRFGTSALGYSPEGLSVSNTLEYAYADWCASRLANALGDAELESVFAKRGEAYKNVFDKETGWFRPRFADGSWAEWNPATSMTDEWFGCIESNLYQQGWFVPHDVDGMVTMMGGREKVLEKLKDMFANTPDDMKWNAYYNHANEPVHFVPFLFNRLGSPWLTQKHTRWICSKAYSNKVEGLVGNEDAGQMSAWYVLAAAGLHPSCPGETRMEITSPVFDRVEFKLDNEYFGGGAFSVEAHGNSPENIYISRALLNGKEYGKCHIDFKEIAAGGKLELFMSAEPSKTWGLIN